MHQREHRWTTTDKEYLYAFDLTHIDEWRKKQQDLRQTIIYITMDSKDLHRSTKKGIIDDQPS